MPRPLLPPRVVALLCITLLLAGACDSIGAPSSWTDRPPTPGASSYAPTPSDAQCFDAQRAVLPRLVRGWRKMVHAMAVLEQELEGVGTGAKHYWTDAFTAARADLTKAGCPDPPSEMAQLAGLTRTLAADPEEEVGTADSARLRQLLRELAGTLAVRKKFARDLDVPLTCAEIDGRLKASYSARTAVTSAGRDAWGVLSVKNRTGRGIYVGFSGELIAAEPRPGTTGVARWTASEGDHVYAPPFQTTVHALPVGGDGRMHLTSDGEVEKVDLNLVSGFAPGSLECPLSAQKTGGSVTVAAAGDIACAPDDPGYHHGNGVRDRCHMRATSQLIAAMKPAAVFALGDLQYNSGEPSNFRASYDRTWGQFKAKTYPVVGNHEYGTRGAAGYFGYFGSRATPLDPTCESKCGGYYSFDLGAWHVVVLNSECAKLPGGNGCAAGSAQNRWLRTDLKRAGRTSVCTVALVHRPRWSSGSTFGAPELTPLVETLVANGADLMLTGHSHSYERFAPQNAAGGLDNGHGIREISVGTGGAYFTGLGATPANSVVRRSHVFGVLALTLADGGYRWAFKADPATPFTDSGSATCH